MCRSRQVALLVLFLLLPLLRAEPEQGPPPRSADQRIAALVRDLDSDRFAVRDRAARELLEIGPGALDHLKRVTERSPSVEVRDRAERLAREIRYRAVTGGPAVAGLRATLRSPKEVYRANEPIPLTLEVANVSDHAVNAPPARQFSYRLAYGAENSFVVDFEFPSHGEIIVRQRTGVKPKRNGIVACGVSGRRVPLMLEPGKVWLAEVRLPQHGPLSPGEYEVHVGYYLREVLPGAKEDLTSNSVRFKVE